MRRSSGCGLAIGFSSVGFCSTPGAFFSGATGLFSPALGFSLGVAAGSSSGLGLGLGPPGPVLPLGIT